MLTKKDIESLIKAQKEVFVTKEEFEGLIDIVATKDELKNLATKGELFSLEKRLGDKIDDMGKDLSEIKTILTEAHVL